MKDKKNIFLLIIACIILIIAIIFAVWNFKMDKNVGKIEQENSNSELEENYQNQVSKTQNLDASYIDFSVFDENGKEVKLSDFRGNPVMVLFWNDENEDSIEMLKRVNKKYDSYKEKMKFLIVDTKKDGHSNVPEEVSMEMYYDNNGSYSEVYHIKEMPAMLYINKENEVFNSKMGLTTDDALEANLDILIENF